MKAEEFRRHGHDLIDWIADYLESPIGTIPVSLLISPPTTADHPFWVSCFRLDWVLMPCCGKPARQPPNWKKQ